jgi:hypothetical protein
VRLFAARLQRFCARRDKMLNINVVTLRPPVSGEQIGDKAAVTFLRTRFGTQ